MRSSASLQSLVRRWAAAATAASLVIVGLLGVTPATADELAPEPPAVEQVVEPAPEPAPAVEPAPEPEVAPETESAPEPAHTFTFQGSVDRGVVLDIAAADVVGCPVDDATLEWGFKETFRSYISGSIANGEWIVADGATYETPSFGWADGTGGYDAETAEGDVGYLGSITFTGHGGILNTTVANPRIVFDGVGTAMLLLDVSGTTQEGEPVNSLGVEFATLDVSGAAVEDGTFTVTDAPATLTADGAAAFGTYPEGEELDPVSFGFTLAADCSDAVAAPGDTADGDATSASSPNLWWVWLLGGIVSVAIIAAIILLLRRRAQA